MDKLEIKQGSFHTNPVFYTSGNRYVRRTATFGNLWFFHLSHRATVIQDLLVRHQFSLVSDKHVKVCKPLDFNLFWNHLENWNQTWYECSLNGFLQILHCWLKSFKSFKDYPYYIWVLIIYCSFAFLAHLAIGHVSFCHG